MYYNIGRLKVQYSITATFVEDERIGSHAEQVC